MSFIETRFPVDISYGSSGGPEYSTDIVISASGYEKRNINWANARAKYNVAHGIKSKTQLDELIAFFRARKGRAIGFRFKDWTDFQAINQTIGVGDGTLAIFQLSKTYSNGLVSEIREIKKAVSGSLSIYVNSVLKIENTHFTANYNTGVITFLAGNIPTTGKIITADFEFDVPVRFDTDRLSAVIDDYQTHSWLDIPLIEVRV